MIDQPYRADLSAPAPAGLATAGPPPLSALDSGPGGRHRGGGSLLCLALVRFGDRLGSRVAVLQLAGYLVGIGASRRLMVVADGARELRTWRIFGRATAEPLGALRSPTRWNFVTAIHGLVVWGLAILIGAVLAFAATRTMAARADLTSPTASTAEPLLAFELDRLFRSDRRPADNGNDTEIRAQAARIITSGLGHTGMLPDDRAYLIRLVAARTGLSQPEAEARVNQAIAQSSEAIAGARHGAVILAFMIAASFILGAAVAWLAAAFGGQHRDNAVAHHFWRRWEVDRMFFIR